MKRTYFLPSNVICRLVSWIKVLKNEGPPKRVSKLGTRMGCRSIGTCKYAVRGGSGFLMNAEWMD